MRDDDDDDVIDDDGDGDAAGALGGNFERRKGRYDVATYPLEANLAATLSQSLSSSSTTTNVAQLVC